ncbi:MAG TPA: hypothetical protein VMU28_11070 [Terriglobales bacterium]|nr:hypothetical protein [Terriglobales bacterium]
MISVRLTPLRRSLVLLFVLFAALAAAAQTVDEYGYFSHRLDKVSDQLKLTSDQTAKLKPLLENETALMEQVYNNPALSREAKLKKYWAIIGKTNGQIKPMLTADQVTAFNGLLQEQKQRYDSLMQQAKEAAKKKT